MKKFIYKIILFFTLAVTIDVASGFVFDWMRCNAKGGSTRLDYYVNEESEDDIVILGPSRAMNHYVPSIIEDSLGLSCINCGQSGNGIIGAYARYSAIRERHIPRLVIYETLPTYDYLESDPYSAFLWRFRPYYQHSGVRELFKKFGDRLDNIELYSSLYRNNSRYLIYLKDMFSKDDGLKGYEPKYGAMTDKEVARFSGKFVSTENDKAFQVDSLRLFYIEKLFNLVKSDGATLVCMNSPFYSYWPSEGYPPIIEICNRTGVRFINLCGMKDISGNRNLFLNSGHLNDDGAREYTKRIIPLIRELLKEGDSFQ